MKATIELQYSYGTASELEGHNWYGTGRLYDNSDGEKQRRERSPGT